jgi:hypothetical protein
MHLPPPLLPLPLPLLLIAMHVRCCFGLACAEQERSRKKIEILSGGSAQTEVLLRRIGAKALPKYLGGDCGCVGPCTSDETGQLTHFQQDFDSFVKRRYAEGGRAGLGGMKLLKMN